MGESHRDSNHQNHHILLHSTANSYRLGVAKGGGEIVEVKGGHIVRSTSRKDRHSKVLTAKGPRDRRVRLSANTAIQFYDVQDRLGYDRPSKAVDWLIKNAKASIDELEKLPPWHPSTMADVSLQQPMLSTQQQELMMNTGQQNSDDAAAAETSDSTAYNNAFGGGGGGSSSTGFLPPSLDSEYSIADTIKSFFPTTGTTASSSNAPIGLYAQDLRLSLQSFQQDPILLHHHQNHQSSTSSSTAGEHPFFSSSHMPMVYDTIPLVPWHTTGGAEDDGGGGGGGYGYNFPPPQGVAPAMHTGVGQNLFYPPQRGPLQSSDSPYIRAWMDPTLSTPAAITTAGFGGFSRFRIPARIQGDLEEEEEVEGHGAVSDKTPTPASSHR